MCNFEVLRDFGGFFFEGEVGFAGGVVEDFHVGPGDLAAPAGAEGFEDGFFGGEAAGEVDFGGGVGEAIGLFGGGEAAVEEVGAMVGEHLGDARDVDEVDAVGRNHGGRVYGRGDWGKGGGGMGRGGDKETGRQGEGETGRQDEGGLSC